MLSSQLSWSESHIALDEKLFDEEESVVHEGLSGAIVKVRVVGCLYEFSSASSLFLLLEMLKRGKSEIRLSHVLL